MKNSFGLSSINHINKIHSHVKKDKNILYYKKLNPQNKTALFSSDVLSTNQMKFKVRNKK